MAQFREVWPSPDTSDTVSSIITDACLRADDCERECACECEITMARFVEHALNSTRGFIADATDLVHRVIPSDTGISSQYSQHAWFTRTLLESDALLWMLIVVGLTGAWKLSGSFTEWISGRISDPGTTKRVKLLFGLACFLGGFLARAWWT